MASLYLKPFRNERVKKNIFTKDDLLSDLMNHLTLTTTVFVEQPQASAGSDQYAYFSKRNNVI